MTSFHVDENEPVSSAIKPRHSLQRKMWGWMVLVACLPLGISIVLFSTFNWSYVSEQHRDDGAMLSHILASSLTGRVGKDWTRRHGEFLDSLSNDERIAFVLVTGPDGKIMHAGLFDSENWNDYVKTQKNYATKGEVDLSQSVSLERYATGLMVRTAPIFNPPLNFGEDLGNIARNNRKFEGAIVLGLRDPKIATVLQDFQIAQIAIVLGAGVICLPLARILMRRWMKPLDAIVTATHRVVTDPVPTPVPVVSKDELGYLTFMFNEMAGKVAAHRRALVEANTSLEQKVSQRTNEFNEMVKLLDQVASTDPLTELPNRRAFGYAIEKNFAEATKCNTDLICLMIDLDGFKQLNDTAGHEAGDDVLTLAARVLKENCRGTDLAARLGGDEFVVLLPTTNQGSAHTIAERIRVQFQDAAADMIAGLEVPVKVTMSIGLASRCASLPLTWEQLLNHADQALYRAKDAGKACLEIYSDSQAA